MVWPDACGGAHDALSSILDLIVSVRRACVCASMCVLCTPTAALMGVLNEFGGICSTRSSLKTEHSLFSFWDGWTVTGFTV